MAWLGAKVSRSEVSSIPKNTFSVGIFWWNRPHTSFLGLIVYMVRSGAKLFRTKTLLNFASKALSNSFFQKTRFRFEFGGNQSGPSLKDPLQVPDGPITRSRAKKIKEVLQGLVQSTWDEASKSPTIKVGLKEGEPILIHLIQAMEDIT